MSWLSAGLELRMRNKEGRDGTTDRSVMES